MREKSELSSQANHPTNVAEKIDLNFANIKLEELSLDEVKMIIYEQQVKQNELEKIKTK
jgi:hypothetical protein